MVVIGEACFCDAIISDNNSISRGKASNKMRMLEQLIREIKTLVIRVYHRFDHERCFSSAAALSFTTLLALVPLVTVIISALSLFPVFGKWSGSVETFLFENFVPAAGEAVKGYILEFAAKAGQLTAVGLGFLLISSLMLLSTIEDAFNQIWKIERGRTWGQKLIVYWAVLTLGPLLISASLSMSSTLLSLSIFSDQAIGASFTRELLKLLPVVFELSAFMLFYQIIPNLEIRVRDSFIGACVATALFEITKVGFGAYILNFDSYQLIYGALATIPIFFIWIYLCWLVLLIGALVAAIMREPRQEP